MRAEKIPAVGSVAQARRELGERLRVQRSEIEATVLARVSSVADPVEGADYVAGLRSAVAGAIDYGIDAIAGPVGDRAVPPPAEAIAQARRAARRGVPLDTVLRRYMAGRGVLSEFLILESEKGGWGGSCLRAVLRDEATAADHLVEAVAAEYRLEVEAGLRSPLQRRVEQVRKLLAGELVDSRNLGYELEEWHLAAAGIGPQAEEAIRALAAKRGCRLLLVRHEDESVWGWLGGRCRIDPVETGAALRRLLTADASLALGEPAEGFAGWRLTHRQAAAAMAIARHRPGELVRYADVALTATALHDDLLADSLQQLYLKPLELEKDGGASLRETLRAYFQSDRNVSSAAAILGVTRRTVANRLRAIEERLGRSLMSASSGLEVALEVAACEEEEALHSARFENTLQPRIPTLVRRRELLK